MRFHDGQTIGAIGISAACEAQDTECARAVLERRMNLLVAVSPNQN